MTDTAKAAAAAGNPPGGPACTAPPAALAWPVAGAPPSAPPSPLPLTPGRPRSIAPLQALDDAVNFRRTRLALDCDDCEPGQLCIDHEGDVALISVYRDMRRQAAAALPPYPRASAAGA
jgi:hypothetical protein